MSYFNANATTFKTIEIKSKGDFNEALEKIEVINGENNLKIINFTNNKNSICLELKEEIDIKKECAVKLNNNLINVSYYSLFDTEEFNSRYYSEEKLGCSYTPNLTTFKVWSPAASSITLLLYQNGNPEVQENPKKFAMKEHNGVWSIALKGDYINYYYTYLVKVYNDIREAVDPYAYAVCANGLKGAVIDFSKTNPENFESDISPSIKNYTDAIIYETSIRDISIHKDSGIKNKGKFLGLAEENTFSNKNVSTGLNHIKELGVTHVQLMPVFDFSYKSTDELNPVKYNWGYDPQNYNVPEGSYSANPLDPYCRIYELKYLISTLHKNNLGVIIDVVYNHMYHKLENNFEKIFPGYYFRRDEDGNFVSGSGCSNDTASERPMFRKFILESVLYWVNEYHIDGFRFDLMGLHDIDTMNTIRESLNKLDRNILLYGEGWNLNTTLPADIKAANFNAPKMPHIGHFNDIIRDTLKGSVFIKQDKGFVNGKEGLENELKKCITGCINYSEAISGPFISAEQSVNYVSCHDNNTLWDKIEFTSSGVSIELKKNMQKLANAIVLTSQGIAFLHSGEEFLRTKSGIENSFISPDNINNLDWDRKADNMDIVSYYKGLIRLRNEHSAFRMVNLEEIRKHLLFLEGTPKNVVAFTIKDHANNDIWKDILIIYNANFNSQTIEIPEGNWYIAADGNKFYDNDENSIKDQDLIKGTKVTVNPISMLMLYCC